VEGCLEWQRDGLGEAEAINTATAEYRRDEDVMGSFLEECCEREGRVETATLREAYERFCRDIGEASLSASELGKRLAKRSISRGGAGRRFYVGVRLKEGGAE
jgi:putative DNA primase/helicase